MTTNDTRTARERAEELYDSEPRVFTIEGPKDAYVKGFLARDAEQDQEGDILPGCTGSEDCPAPAHQHGCFADLQAHCNEPEAHPAEPTTVTAEQVEAVERRGAVRALREAATELDAEEENGITIDALNESVRQIAWLRERADRIEGDPNE